MAACAHTLRRRRSDHHRWGQLALQKHRLTRQVGVVCATSCALSTWLPLSLSLSFPLATSHHIPLGCTHTCFSATAHVRTFTSPPASLRRRLPGYKWLRGVARGEFTGLHTDRVFLGRGSDRLLTIWLVRRRASFLHPPFPRGVAGQAMNESLQDSRVQDFKCKVSEHVAETRARPGAGWID